MDANEQKVRAAWKGASVEQPWLELSGDSTYHIYLGDFRSVDSRVREASEAEAWAAAAAFTDERLEEIRQLREEIAWIKQASYAGDDSFSQSWGYDARENCTRTIRHCRASRTLDRLEAILAEKTAGIRPEAL